MTKTTQCFLQWFNRILILPKNLKPIPIECPSLTFDGKWPKKITKMLHNSDFY